MTTPLHDLVTRLRALGHENRPEALLRVCHHYGGIVLRPGDGTHLFEIALLGVYARGADLTEAARNWLAAARAMTATADDELALARALGRLQMFDPDATPASLAADWQVIHQRSRDLTLRELAQNFLAMIGEGTANRQVTA